MSRQIEKKNLYHCEFCELSSKCVLMLVDEPCDNFKLIKLDIRMVSE